MQRVVEEAFEAVCGRSIDDPLALSIGEDEAETVAIVGIPNLMVPETEETTEVTVPRVRVLDETVPADEGATVPFRPGDSVRPPMESLPPVTPPMPSIPPSSAGVGGGQTWIKRALAEPGHAKGAMWLVRLGFAAVVLMMVGALVWVVSMSDDAPEPSAQPPQDESVDPVATEAPSSASAGDEGSDEPPDDPSADPSTEPASEASSEPSSEASAASTGDVDAAVPASTGSAPPPAVSIDPAWPPKGATTGTSEPPSQFLKPGPLGPEMDP
jgi:hypothetical protein